MAKILLDYVFPITVISSIPAASTAWLKKVCVVAKPKAGQEGNVGTLYLCTSMVQVAARTDNTESQRLFDGGMTSVYILLMDDLDLVAAMTANMSTFYTVLISSDFDIDDITLTKATGEVTVTSYANLLSSPDSVQVGDTVFVAQSGAVVEGAAIFRAATSNDATAASLAAQINAHLVAKTKVVATVLSAVVTLTAIEEGAAGNDIEVVYADPSETVGITLAGLVGGKLSGGAGFEIGSFDGVIGASFDDETDAQDFAVASKHSGFYSLANLAKNMFYAFGKLLSGANWRNQQYLELPVTDGVTELGDATNLFENRVSFAIDDDELGKRLGLFAAGGKAIVAPYVLKEVRINLQSAALSWIALNQPDYTPTQASLLEEHLTDTVIRPAVERGDIVSGTVSIKADQDNFVASGSISIPTPRALWRVEAEMQET